MYFEECVTPDFPEYEDWLHLSWYGKGKEKGKGKGKGKRTSPSNFAISLLDGLNLLGRFEQVLHALEQAAAQKRVTSYEPHDHGNGDSKSEGNGKGKTKNDGKGKVKGKGKGKTATAESIARLNQVLHAMEQVVVQDRILPDFPKYEYNEGKVKAVVAESLHLHCATGSDGYRYELWQVAWHNIHQGVFDPDRSELWQEIVLARVSTNTFANVDDTLKDDPDTPMGTPRFVFASGSRTNVDLAACTTILDIKLQLATSLHMDPCDVDLIALDRVLCNTESVNVILECDVVQIVFSNKPLIMCVFRYHVGVGWFTSKSMCRFCDNEEMWRGYLSILRPDLDPKTVQELKWALANVALH